MLYFLINSIRMVKVKVLLKAQVVAKGSQVIPKWATYVH